MPFSPSLAGTRLSFDDVFGASQDAANEALLGRVSLLEYSTMHVLLLATLPPISTHLLVWEVDWYVPYHWLVCLQFAAGVQCTEQEHMTRI
jgi:hypothetical protein